ncbi:hypothetical protein [Thiobacillus sp.]
MSTTITTQAQPTALALPDPSAAAVSTGTQLLAYLAPLFPNVASAARTEAGAASWIASWATQIEAEGIGPRRLAGALTLLGRLDPSVPLSWPRFAALVREHKFLHPDVREDDHEIREREARDKLMHQYPGARFAGVDEGDGPQR